jgi:hypothetical protein
MTVCLLKGDVMHGGMLECTRREFEKVVLPARVRMARHLAKLGKVSGFEEELRTLGYKIVATKRNGRRRKPAGRIMMRCRRRKAN